MLKLILSTINSLSTDFILQTNHTYLWWATTNKFGALKPVQCSSLNPHKNDSIKQVSAAPPWQKQRQQRQGVARLDLTRKNATQC